MCLEASFELVHAGLLGYDENGYWRGKGLHTPIHLNKIRNFHWAMFVLLVTVTLLQVVEMVFSCFGLRKKKKKKTKAVVKPKSHGSSDARETGCHYEPVGRDFGVTF